jgi:Raf kinase inhibitor-like YbhB/YbcL family protein
MRHWSGSRSAGRRAMAPPRRQAVSVCSRSSRLSQCNGAVTTYSCAHPQGGCHARNLWVQEEPVVGHMIGAGTGWTQLTKLDVSSWPVECNRRSWRRPASNQRGPPNCLLPKSRKAREMKHHRSRAAIAAFMLGAFIVVMSGCSSQSSPAASSTPVPAGVPSSAAAKSGKLVDPYTRLPTVPSLTVTSETFKDGQPFPTEQFSGVFKWPGGKDWSPQLSWSGLPAGTKSVSVVFHDPDGPVPGGFCHWAVGDIPATTTSLPVNAGALNSKLLPSGAFQLPGDAGTPQYIGAAPPPGSGLHRHYFIVSALDVAKSGVDPKASCALFNFSNLSHTLARGMIMTPISAA